MLKLIINIQTIHWNSCKILSLHIFLVFNVYTRNRSTMFSFIGGVIQLLKRFTKKICDTYKIIYKV